MFWKKIIIIEEKSHSLHADDEVVSDKWELY